MSEAKHSILIVDDDLELLQLYSAVFKNFGFSVFAGKDGAEGLGLLQTHKPELLFTGIMMPRLSGWELIEKMRQNPQTASIPVVVSSHLGRDEDRTKALQLGARAFVIKGKVPPKDLVQLILDILESKSYRVVIQEDKLDAPRLREKLKAGSPLVLELRVGPSSIDFTARLIREEDVSRKRNAGNDVEKVLHDIESNLGE